MPGICLIYPPKVKDVVGNSGYPMYIKALTLSQEELDEELTAKDIHLDDSMNVFEYLLNNAFNSPIFNTVIIQAFDFFIHEPITFLFDKKQILIGDLKEKTTLQTQRILDEDNFFQFQNLIREINGQKALPDPKEEEKLHPKVREMRAKARYRDRVKAKAKDGLKLDAILSSICCMGLGINPLNIGELSYPALSNLLQVYQEKEKYDLDVRSLLAGADSKKVKPKYWIRNLDE